MATTPQVYNQVFGYIDGALLVENTEIEVEMDGDDQMVLTIVNGFSGVTPSPKYMKVTIKDVIPPTGVQFNAEKAFLNTERHEFKAQLATGETMISTGFFQKPKRTAGVGKTVTYDYSFVGTPSLFQ
jgi:hypothetical protein